MRSEPALPSRAGWSLAARARFRERLRAALDADPLEDGMYHPAEGIIEEALAAGESQPVLDWMRDLSLDAEHPSLSAEILRCIGRQGHVGSALWRTELVRNGLTMDSLEIRDAAVRAAEWWGDPEMQSVLESHSERESWLEEYIADVIDDLGE